MAACHISGDGSAISTTAMPGVWTSSRAASQRQHLRRRRVRTHEQDVGQFAVVELLEEPGGVAREAARRQDMDVPIGRLLDPQDQVLTGSGQNDAAHEKAFP
jgi:hypothetical protein